MAWYKATVAWTWLGTILLTLPGLPGESRPRTRALRRRRIHKYVQCQCTWGVPCDSSTSRSGLIHFVVAKCGAMPALSYRPNRNLPSFAVQTFQFPQACTSALALICGARFNIASASFDRSEPERSLIIPASCSIKRQLFSFGLEVRYKSVSLKVR